MPVSVHIEFSTNPRYGLEGVQEEDRKRTYYPPTRGRDKRLWIPQKLSSQFSKEKPTNSICLGVAMVNILNALSVILGEGVGTIIFSGISILLVAARDTAASRDALIELFDKIKDFFVRLKTYSELPQTVEMTNAMGKIMAEVKGDRGCSAQVS
ncbi:hypothetical protein V8E53_014446 [Lactarius tabidus]